MSRARALHQRELSMGFGDLRLPGALDAVYPNAPKSWGWQWIFRAAVDLKARGLANFTGIT